MNGKTEIGREWLRRMIALLLSLSRLAEQASTRSWRVRRRLLACLRRGETAAFLTVAGVALDCGAPLPVQAVAAGRHWKCDDDGDDPENALRLAHRFRALAMALTCLLALAEQGAAAVGMHGTMADRTGAFGTSAASPTHPAFPFALGAAIRAPPPRLARSSKPGRFRPPQRPCQCWKGRDFARISFSHCGEGDRTP